MTAVFDTRASRLPIRVENLFAIADLARVGTDFRSLRETAVQICVAVVGMPDVDWATITLGDAGHQTQVYADPGASEAFLADAALALTANTVWSPAFEAYTSGREVLIADIGERPELAALADAARKHGWISTLHLPIVARGRTLGTVNLYGRAAVAYTPDEVDLLLTMARAAGVALETAAIAERHRIEEANTDARRVDLVRQHNRLTERLHQGEHELTEVMRAQTRLAELLLEAGVDKVDAICGLLAERLEASVMVCDLTGKTRAFRGDPAVRATMSAAIARRDPVKLAKLRDGGVVGGVTLHRIGHDRVLGLLLVLPPDRDSGQANRVLVRHAAGLLAFELEADRAEHTARDIARPAILHALVRGHLSARQAHAVGKFVDVTGQPLRIGFLRTGDDVKATAVSHSLNFVSRSRGCLAAAAELDGVLLLVEDRDLTTLRTSLASLLENVNLGTWAVGLSEPFRELDQSPTALEQALVALAVAPPQQIAVHESLGATASLLRRVPPAAAASYVEDILSPLIEYDRKRKGALIETVSSYLRHRGSLRQAAVELGVHENTVQLRLARASQLMGSDLHDPQWLGLLAVALAWHRLLGDREPTDS